MLRDRQKELNMRWLLIQNSAELAGCYQDLKKGVDRIQSKYSSHVIDALLEWFDSFSTDEKNSFASKRGLNFLGRKSVLQSLFFILVYRDDELISFAPLFRFKVDFADNPTSYEVVSFCPDSTIFFYNDFLVKDGSELCAVRTLLEFFKQYNDTAPYVVLFNHVPSNSTNLSLLLKHSGDLPQYGFNIGISPVFWRGGLYPWNLGKLQSILQNALQSADVSDETRENIRAALDLILASNKTMLVFQKNHLPLKSTIYKIFGESKPSDNILECYTEVEAVLQSCPVKYPYLALPRTTEAFINSLSSSKRYYFKRYRKQFLENEGSFEKLRADAISDGDIHDFISLHRERWGKSSNILNSMTSSFLASFLRKLAGNGFLTLFFAVHQSRRIACLCCIDFKERREFFSSGRTRDDEKLRSGKLLLYDSIIDSINEGLSIFDFGYGDEAYKSDYDWSYLTNNTVALFHDVQSKQLPNIFPLYEEVML